MQKNTNKKLLKIIVPAISIVVIVFIIVLLKNISSKNAIAKNNKNKHSNDIFTNSQRNTNKNDSVTDDEKAKLKSAGNIFESLQSYIKGIKLKYNDKGVPVLFYHSFGYKSGNPIIMPPEMFEKQMKYLKDNGYTPITLNDLYYFLTCNKPVPEKSVVITMDDGYEDNYKYAYPILKKYNFKATIFVITGVVDKDSNYLTASQLKEMDKNGIDIESHTVNHEKLDTISYDKQFETLKNSKQYLENLLQRKVNYIAYPNGENNIDTVKAAQNSGYLMAFTTAGRWSDKNDGILTLDRVYISTYFSMNVFANRISNPNYPVQ